MSTFTIRVRDDFPFDTARVAGRPFKKGAEVILSEANITDEIRKSPSLEVTEVIVPEPEPLTDPGAPTGETQPGIGEGEGGENSSTSTSSVEGGAIKGTVVELPGDQDLGTAIGGFTGTPGAGSVDLPVLAGSDASADASAESAGVIPASIGANTDLARPKESEASTPAPAAKPAGPKPTRSNPKN